MHGQLLSQAPAWPPAEQQACVATADPHHAMLSAAQDRCITRQLDNHLVPDSCLFELL